MRDMSSEPETSRLIDVGGRDLFVVESGRGDITVILETGLGAESEDWREVQQRVAQFARVCRYERAGCGRSGPASKPRTGAAVVEDLKAMLTRAEISGPYILVGQSLGGLFMRLFAKQFPEKVCGLVLVDSFHPEQFDRFGPTFPAPTSEDPPQLTQMRSFWTGGWRNPSNNAEGIDLVECVTEDGDITSLGELPIRILAAGTMTNNPGVPAEARPFLQGMWDTLQADFLRLSSQSQLTKLPLHGHFVHRENPEAVTSAIKDLVTKLSSGAPTNGGLG